VNGGKEWEGGESRSKVPNGEAGRIVNWLRGVKFDYHLHWKGWYTRRTNSLEPLRVENGKKCFEYEEGEEEEDWL